MLLLSQKLRNFRHVRFFSSKRGLILGIETSCDDTGCAVVDTKGNILGESLHSQSLIHVLNGGIIPPIAQDLHRINIDNVAITAVKEANLQFSDLDAIAVTVKPGLPLSLKVGLKYGKYLCQKYNKPLIPIHHMKAHALTARMSDNNVKFPFLVLLISGGHCLLAVAETLDKFFILGETLDDSPGEVFDKIARRMKLRNIAKYAGLSGGQAVEQAALEADNYEQFNFTIPLLQYKNCDFSMAGLKAQVNRHVLMEERKNELPPDAVIPNVNNLCAGFQLSLTRHLCYRVQRAMVYCFTSGLIPESNQTLVVSGGVACNSFIKKALKIVCDKTDYNLVVPPPKLCTDNGVMIAWNGVEKWKVESEIFEDFSGIEIEQDCPLGVNLREDVAKENISCKWVKLTDLIPQKVKVCSDV